MAKLIACEGCSRHVRASEASCPFCGTTREACTDACVEEIVPASSFGSRAQMMGFGVAVGAAAIATAMLTTGCPAYGAPGPDPSRDAGGDAASNDSGAPVPMYGAPAP